jgi:recombination protein RecT
VAIKQGLVAKLPDLKHLMPRGIGAERYIRQAYFAIAKDPKLQQCTPSSLVMRTIEAAEVGLSLDRIMQEAALIPRKNNRTNAWEAQLMPEYRGLLRLAHQHPDVDHVDVVEVFEQDHFRVVRGTKPGIEHELSTSADPGAATCYYAIVWFKSGQCKFDVMNLRQIEAVRARIRGADKPDSPWVTSPGEQAKKTVLKRVLKTVPRSEHAASALGQSDRVEAGDVQEAELVLEPAEAPEKVDPKKAEPPHSLDCRPGEDLEPEDVEAKPTSEEEPPHPADEAAPEPPADEGQERKDAEAAALQEEEHLKKSQAEAEQQALKDLGWDGPALVEPERVINADEKKLVRQILTKEKVTQAARGREWLEKQTGKKIQKLDDLTVLELVPLLKAYYPDHVARYIRQGAEQEEML